MSPGGNMRNKGIMVFSILLILFSIVACRPTYLIPIPTPDTSGQENITAQVVASKLDLQQLNNDIKQDLIDNSIDGLDARWSLSDPSDTTLYSARRAAKTNLPAAKSADIPNKVYIVVTFTDYKQDNGTVHVTEGEMILTAKGEINATTLELASYSAVTTTPLKITTTVGTQTSNNNAQITIPTAEIKATISVDENNVVASGDITITAPSAYTGATIVVDSTEVPVDEAMGEIPGMGGLFADGYGTACNPYIIETANQFNNLNNPDVQEMFLKGENDNLYFRLDNNIDLRDINTENNYVAKVFSGTLDGNSHTITGSNNLDYIFDYAFEDVIFKNFTVKFDSKEITRIFRFQALLATDSFTSGGETIYCYDKEKLSLTMNNIDFVPYSDNCIYFIGDNNAALYVDNNCNIVAAYYNGKFDENSYKLHISPVPEEEYTSYLSHYLPYEFIFTECNISGKYYGGFGDSGAAIFLGGQFPVATVNLTDCSFDNGSFEGYNVSFVVANGHDCTAGNEVSVTVSNVDAGNHIISYSGNGDLGYAIKDSGKPPVEFEGTVLGSLQHEEATAISDIIAKQNQALSFSSSEQSVSRYEIKLFLPTVYWYASNTSTHYFAETNSNTITINCLPEMLNSLNLYLGKVLSSTEAKSSTIASNPEFENIAYTGITQEGYSYGITEKDGTYYLVINYGDGKPVYMYSDNGLSSIGFDKFNYVKAVVLLGFDKNNNIVAHSTRVPISN